MPEVLHLLVLRISSPTFLVSQPVVLQIPSPIFVSSVDLLLLALGLTSPTSKACLTKLAFTPKTVAPSALYFLKSFCWAGA